MFSQLPFYDLNDFIGEHVSQNDDTALQEEEDSDLKPFIHISFEEKTPLKKSRYENIIKEMNFMHLFPLHICLCIMIYLITMVFNHIF